MYKVEKPKSKIIGIRIDRGMAIQVEKYMRKNKIKSISELVRNLLTNL